MGSALGAGFTNLANDLAMAGVGIATLALVALGIGLYVSIFDYGVMRLFKDALLRIIAGSAIIGGACVVAGYIASNFRL